MDWGSIPHISTMKPSLEVLRANGHKILKNIGWDGECLIWIGGLDKWGYGEFQFRHRGHTAKYKIRAHQALFLLNGGIVPEGQILRHTCDKTMCVSFTHLVPGTHQENVADRVSRGRSATGQKNGRFTHGKFVRSTS